MNVVDLFPPCHLNPCPMQGVPGDGHKHILPTQQELLESTEQIVACVGGYGSSKTLGACVLGHLLSQSIPGNRGIIMRRSLPKLHDSTQRIFMEVLDRAGVDCEYREQRDGWPGRVIYPNRSEVTFRETSDPGKFLGPEYGWGLLDEAQEEPEKLFKDFLGRLRLPLAARYLKFILCTNPPRKGHWLQKTFPQPGTWARHAEVVGKSVRVSYRMIQSRTGDNPFLDLEYVARLKLTHTAEELRGVLSGEYRVDYDGKPVYKPPFSHVWHVGQFPTKVMSIVRSWDFGFHHPVVLFHQMYRCVKRRAHMTVLREFLPEDLRAEELADKVLEKSKVWFPSFHPFLFVDCGDEAGAAVSDKGPGPIIKLAGSPWGLHIRYSHIRDIDPGVRLIVEMLRDKCECGHFLLEVDRECSEVVEMLNGGYHYPKDRTGTVRPHAKPVKDGYYDNIADSLRYAVWNFYRVARQDEGFMQELEKWQGPPQGEPSDVDPDTFAWMGDWGQVDVSPATLEEAYRTARLTGLRGD